VFDVELVSELVQALLQKRCDHVPIFCQNSNHGSPNTYAITQASAGRTAAPIQKMCFATLVILHHAVDNASDSRYVFMGFRVLQFQSTQELA
jgi:hypothetical protein